MSEAQATIRERRRLSFIWFVPIVALLLGIWMVVHTFRSQGPLVRIVFSTAEGIEAGKTKIKMRSVEVGLVESAGLADDLESVIVEARLNKAATPLLREDTQFWVVRPRIGAGGISGLGTVLSGGYIQLSPGTGAQGRRDFVGLENPPVTPPGAPGLRLRLTSRRAGSVSRGDPILYQGYRVGRIESSAFDIASGEMRYAIFIDAPYDALVTTTTRFWNASGVSASVTADGIELDTASLETLLVGGVAMGRPTGIEPGEPVEADASFELYPNQRSVSERPYRYGLEYVVRFAQSVRGLEPGAPVEYRGIRLGQIVRVLVAEGVARGLNGTGAPIPVLIRLEPGRLTLPDSDEGVEKASQALAKAVRNGMRATLATGNLITGRKYVSLDIFPDASPPESEEFAGYPTIPTVAGGMEAIEQRLASLLDKLSALPLEGPLEKAEQVFADLDAFLASSAVQELPASLEASLAGLREAVDSVSVDSALQERLLRTITELDRTLRSLRNVANTIEEKPNALIFNREPLEDPWPPAGDSGGLTGSQ